MKIPLGLGLLLLCLPPQTLAAAPSVALSLDPDGGEPAKFAASEIRRACAQSGVDFVETEPSPEKAIHIVIHANPRGAGNLISDLKLTPSKISVPQGYAIRRATAGDRRTVVVLGADPVGAMYGGLDIAEAIRLGRLDAIPDSDHSPHIAQRGIKFNIPLDLRTPSYSDNSDAAQLNIPEMWSVDFWREFLDEMARDRFNVLTLWNLHPFPSLVKVPEFPEVALNDVWRTRTKVDDSFSHSGSDMVRPEMLRDVEVVKTISIDQKIQFWREVMRLARDRGIDVYWFTWNIFTFGADGKHGITQSQTNPKTIEYFRASVREMALTYPLLAGIGITAGEQMENRQDAFSKEKWLWQTYGEGIRDALKQQSERRFRLIHRFHQTGQGEILREWKNYPGPLDLSFKYAIAHMYSSAHPPFIKQALPYLSPELRSWLTVRNDDIYSFRWGDPQFAREFIRAIPGADKVAGFYMGPDGYTWGREFLDRAPETPRQLVIKKQWYSFMLWGRLSYEPDLTDEHFIRILAAHFPKINAEALFRAWSDASKIFPQITRFFWGDIDLRWFPEACLSHPRHKGFYTVRHFIEGNTMPASGILNILEWRQVALNNRPSNGLTPLQVADNLERDAEGSLRAAAKLGGALLGPSRAGQAKELRQTLGDIEAFADIGLYYAEKIRGACELALFDRTGDPKQREAAVRHLEIASGHWKSYAAAYTREYVQPVLYNRVGYVDIPGLQAKVNADINMAREWKQGTIIDSAVRRPAGDSPFQR